MLQTTCRSASNWILKNTKSTIDHLTPEIKLRLITPECPMWHQQPENCPYPDPYWAFYWPGGQTLARHILNCEKLEGKVCLDFGSGCGAVGLAASMANASCVIFNDIDPVANVSSALNVKLNRLDTKRFQWIQQDLLSSTDKTGLIRKVDTVFVGDMFYDSEFAEKLIKYLIRWADDGKRILVGDPGRHGFLSSALSVGRWKLLSEYPLPSYITKEHYGFSTGKVVEIIP